MATTTTTTTATTLGGHVTGKIFLNEHTPILARTWQHEGDDVAHDHTFMEIAVVLRGRSVHRTIYGEQPIGAGEVFVLAPGAWHAYIHSHHLLIYNLLLGMELLQRELAWTEQDAQLGHLLWTGPLEANRRGILRLALAPPALRKARKLLDALAEVTQVDSRSNRGEQVGRLLLFLSHLGDQIAPPGHSGGGGGGGPRVKPPHPAVTRGIRLLQDNLAESWTLEALSEQLNIDSSYLVRLFRAGTGLSPILYLTRARAERAAAMLLRTELPIAEIGRAVGWDDPNYFARRFKAHFGLSATDYRRRYADKE